MGRKGGRTGTRKELKAREKSQRRRRVYQRHPRSEALLPPGFTGTMPVQKSTVWPAGAGTGASLPPSVPGKPPLRYRPLLLLRRLHHELDERPQQGRGGEGGAF